ncbi:hypothetical protein F4808DRAFT_407777 [Astrocystis sublimbata]|nr:hypothetical protein F4808DRAFT_407777 [Astrocystis sublimbata]
MIVVAFGRAVAWIFVAVTMNPFGTTFNDTIWRVTTVLYPQISRVLTAIDFLGVGTHLESDVRIAREMGSVS